MITPPQILAENFDGLWVLVLGLPIAAAAVAGLSYIPSSRAHWAGPALAAPAAALGALLFIAAAAAHAPALVLLLSAFPAAAGTGSIGLWADRRNRRQ